MTNFDPHPQEFEVTYTDVNGITFTGKVTKVSPYTYRVFIPEKEVVISFEERGNGELVSGLNEKRKIDWVNGLCEEVAKKAGLR